MNFSFNGKEFDINDFEKVIIEHVLKDFANAQVAIVESIANEMISEYKGKDIDTILPVLMDRILSNPDIDVTIARYLEKDLRAISNNISQGIKTVVPVDIEPST